MGGGAKSGAMSGLSSFTLRTPVSQLERWLQSKTDKGFLSCLAPYFSFRILGKESGQSLSEDNLFEG
jgi:hypothetical protein